MAVSMTVRGTERRSRQDFAERATTPSERIVRVDIMAAIFNREKMEKDGKHVVDLACGHKAYTRNVERMVCPRCTEMLRRSIRDGSEDWESFRYRNGLDRMEWAADLCRQFNEKLEATPRGDGE